MIQKTILQYFCFNCGYKVGIESNNDRDILCSACDGYLSPSLEPMTIYLHPPDR